MNRSIINISKCPELIERTARWFSAKWGIEYEAYLESMNDSLTATSVPEWYVCLDGERIVGGIGVIENDFHPRHDLTPNLCALYVEPDVRGEGIAGALLGRAAQDMNEKGISPLYLLTDHTSFYERYGWEFFCFVKDSDGEESRMYIKK